MTGRSARWSMIIVGAMLALVTARAVRAQESAPSGIPANCLTMDGAGHCIKGESAPPRGVPIGTTSDPSAGNPTTDQTGNSTGEVAAALRAGLDEPLNMSLGVFLQYCNSGNQAGCAKKLGDDEANILYNDWVARGGGDSVCWPETWRNNEGFPDETAIGQQILSWLNGQPNRANDRTQAAIYDATAALYPCDD